MKTARTVMFSDAMVLFLLVIGMDGIFEDLQFYYRGVDQTGFQIIARQSAFKRAVSLGNTLLWRFSFR